MLIQFNFSNFKSFRNEVSLDMTATSITEHPYNIIVNSRNERLLKVASIYGANASGKTSIIDAFELMKFLVMYSFKMENEGKGIPVKRFAFDKISRTGKSEFEVFFIYKEMEYQYGFKVDNRKVFEEWLYKRDFRGKNKYFTLFERNDDKIKCGDSFKEANKFVELVEESTLFLSLISNARIKEAKEVYNWFSKTEVMDFGNVFIESILTRALPVKELNDKKYLNGLEKFLKAIDIGIDGIRVEKSQDSVDDDGKPSYKVYSKHKSLDDNKFIEIPFQEESSGTQKMFALYSYIMESLKEGSTLFVDELDAKLHPLLLRYIINMFHNPETNKNNAQLIYTTHDIFTLNKDTFRRDQIWFTEKDEMGISNLFSLVEYKAEDKKVRKDATYNKDYLLGRYGAVPLLKEFDLFEEN